MNGVMKKGIRRFPHAFIFIFSAIMFILGLGINTILLLVPAIRQISFFADGLSLACVFALVFGFIGGLFYMVRNL